MPVELNMSTGNTVRADAVSEAVFRLSVHDEGAVRDSALNRYGFIDGGSSGVEAVEESGEGRANIGTSAGGLALACGESVRVSLENGAGGAVDGEIRRVEGRGYVAAFRCEEGEQFYGLGDIHREHIDRRGLTFDMWVTNVDSYIPIPLLMSNRGYGILVNTTRRHRFIVDQDGSSEWRVAVPGDVLDLYCIVGRTPKEILGHYTALTGRPALPPKWSFGLWFVCRNYDNDERVMETALNFRDRKIPCDAIGLEPGWMETYYDASTEKKWHPQRFLIPPYKTEVSMLSALHRMGFRSELWLCDDYDHSYEAERRARTRGIPDHSLRHGSNGQARVPTLTDDATWGFAPGAVELDEHVNEPILADKVTKPDEPWFEHLKKFVDQGVDFFKQDGSFQVCEHPDRKWGNGMADDEMHNLNPLLYSQDMYEGFKAHTGRRPCCFTVSGWAGLQRHTGTWTGDTGGGPKTLTACLNLALSGHSTVTCDMDVSTKAGVHYGFLMPWAQLNSWNYWAHPWLQGDELYPLFRDYAELRSRLIPYLYTYAYEAHTTGVPMMRPLIMEYPNDPAAVDVHTQWFLGRELMATAFSDEVYLPEGMWWDYWSGERHEGPCSMNYQPPANRGGGLFVRAGSVLPLGPVRQCVEATTDEGFTLEVFVSPGELAEFTLYDDDGISFEYEQGAFTQPRIRAVLEGGDVVVDADEGVKVDKVIVHGANEPGTVAVNGKRVACEWCKPQKGEK